MKFLTLIGTISVLGFILSSYQPLNATIDFRSILRGNQMHVSEQLQNSDYSEGPLKKDFLDSPLMIGILWPVVFALLEVLANSLSGNQTRPDDEKKYKMIYKENNQALYLLPLDLGGLQKQFSSQKQILDVDVLPAGFLEASFGIDLCIGALSTTFINLLIMGNNSLGIMTSPTMHRALIVMVMQIIALVSIIYFLQSTNTIIDYHRRILWVQFTNFLGFLAIFISFYTLGKILL